MLAAFENLLALRDMLWEWLESVAPCVDDNLMFFANCGRIFKLTTSLGADHGTRHAPANLTEDITTLIESLDEVYRIQKG